MKRLIQLLTFPITLPFWMVALATFVLAAHVVDVIF